MKLKTETPEALRILRSISEGSTSLVVNAYAGTGKTSVEVQSILASPPELQSATWVTTHSAHITKSNSELLPPEVYSKGMHSFGLGILHQYFQPKSPGSYVVKDKYVYILRDILPNYTQDYKEQRVWSKSLLSLWNLCRAAMADITEKRLKPIANQHLLDCPFTWTQAVEILEGMKARGIREATYRVDFTDMLWLPLVLDLPTTRRFERAYLDEGQDCTPLHARFFLNYSEGALKYIFGDKYQSIFSFMGASGDVLGIMAGILKATPEGCEVLPLSVCWRCPTLHLDYAREIIPDIKNAPDAIRGELNTINRRDILRNPPKPGRAFICRTNNPGIDMCHTLNTLGVPSRMPGKDIGRYLTEMFDRVCKSESDFHAGFPTRLDKFVQSKINRYSQEEGNELAIASYIDRAESLRRLYFGADDLNVINRHQFKDYIASLFVEEEEDRSQIVTCATVHKYKGWESDNIYVLDPKHIRHPKAKTTIEKQQEINIDYIARTRSRYALNLVSESIELEGIL